MFGLTCRVGAHISCYAHDTRLYPTHTQKAPIQYSLNWQSIQIANISGGTSSFLLLRPLDYIETFFVCQMDPPAHESGSARATRGSVYTGGMPVGAITPAIFSLRTHAIYSARQTD